MHTETPAAWAVLTHGTEAPATPFPQGLMQERHSWERVARETFPADSPTAYVQAWAFSRAFSEAFPPCRPWRSSHTPVLHRICKLYIPR